MIRVLVVDDHALVRTGVRFLLSTVEGIEVVGEAEDGRQAVALVQELKPDVVIMDVALPGMDGLEATREMIALKSYQPRVVMLSIYGDPGLVQGALENGATGYVLKRWTSELVDAIVAASKGQRFLSSGIAPAHNA
jgi:DNA-binding NarL/FixJ family response regulator